MAEHPAIDWSAWRWYAAIVRRQRHSSAADALAAAGFATYVPRTVELRQTRRLVSRNPRRWDRRARQVKVPVVRGIVFIGAADLLERNPDAWRAVIDVPDVRYIVGDNGAPSRIPTCQMEKMAMRVENGADFVSAPETLAPGDTVRLTAEAFAWQGLEATVRALHGERLRIFRELLGAEREIEVHRRHVERVGS